LTYVGDATVGAKANIGAGTITCNYDGYLKHKTEIGEDAFIGSNTALVATNPASPRDSGLRSPKKKVELRVLERSEGIAGG